MRHWARWNPTRIRDATPRTRPAGQHALSTRGLPAPTTTEDSILRPRVGLVCLFSVLMVTLSGCREELSTQYGQRKGPLARTSVNGTAVLGEMFERHGHTVFSWNSLSPRLHRRADVIVWFPNDFHPPSMEVCRWLERWLGSGSDRTLVYVGRDFDAAPWYWETVSPGAPSSQAGEFSIRRSEAKTGFLVERRALLNSEDCPWFTIDGKAQPRTVRSLQGDPAWLEGVDPSKIATELNGRILPPDGAEILLESEGDVLVSRQDRRQGRLIVVANGSFLLNAALVNHEHRKLAGQLVEAVGAPTKTVVFLESHSGGPPIRDEDFFPSVPTGMEIFHVWPTNWILLHLAIVGVLFCFARYPIFGRPLEQEREDRSDFGKHIQAMGEMLKRSGDLAYAYARLLHYRQTKAEGGRRKAEAAVFSPPMKNRQAPNPETLNPKTPQPSNPRP